MAEIPLDWGAGGAAPGCIPRMDEPVPGEDAPSDIARRFALSRPRKLLTLIVTGRDDRGRPDGFDGLTPYDREVLHWLLHRTDPVTLADLVGLAEDAGYAVLIRSDLPRLN